MADENQTDSTAPAEQPKEGLFEGSLEQPEGDEGKSEEQPKVATPASDPEDSELGDLFADLKNGPDEFKSRAEKAIKKTQAWLTQKRQKESARIKELEANQVTEDLKRDYGQLYGWYDTIQKNPVEGLKRLASQFGVQPEALSSNGQANAAKPELTWEQLETKEDFAKFAIQEIQKAESRMDEKVKPLEEKIEQFTGTITNRDMKERGAKALDEATKLPGFLSEEKGPNGEPMISKSGHEAINAVLRMEFTGPNALKNAFKAYTAENSLTKVKQLEEHIASLKSGIAGAVNAPKETTTKTTIAPSSPKTFWKDLRAEPLSE